MLVIHKIPVLSDNYVYLAHDPETAATAIVDPAVARPVLATLDLANADPVTVFAETRYPKDVF